MSQGSCIQSILRSWRAKRYRRNVRPSFPRKAVEVVESTDAPAWTVCDESRLNHLSKDNRPQMI